MSNPLAMPIATPRTALFTLVCAAAFVVTLAGCQKNDTPPPAPVVVTVPGPTGATGSTGTTGAPGATGATGDAGSTVILVPPAASAASN